LSEDKDANASSVRASGERPLGIPTIRDRVVQTAAKLVLEPIFEADLESCAYGYRPKRSGQDAVRKVHEHLIAGYTDVVDADLSKYFDTIPHCELLQCVARRIVDREILRLIKAWLTAPVEEREGSGKRRLTGGKQTRQGTPLTRGEDDSRPCHRIRTPARLRSGPVESSARC
jgi:RNA-directed DNA polymerase